jgi:FtsP/CotA-like multicopper oxidase with cupredoxin domain
MVEGLSEKRLRRMRTRALVIPWAVVGLVVFIIMAVIIGVGPTLRPPTAAGAAPSSPSPNPAGSPADESVPTTFKTEQRRPFEAPIELQSDNGVLRTAFTVEPTTFPVAGAMIKGYAYQGQYIGPTLRVHPGDTVRVQPAWPRDVYVTNRHFRQRLAGHEEQDL